MTAGNLAATVRAGITGHLSPDASVALRALEKQAADAQAEAERNYLDYGVRIQASESARVRAEEALRQIEQIVAAAEPALSIPPADCTNNCADGPCDCSGVARVRGWSLDMDGLRDALGEFGG